MGDQPIPQAPFLRSVLPEYGTLEYVEKLALTALAIAALIYVLGRTKGGGLWAGIQTGAALK